MLCTMKDYVSSYQACLQRKGAAYRAPLAAAPQATVPLEKVSASLLELDTTTEGNIYVLFIFVHASRYL